MVSLMLSSLRYVREESGEQVVQGAAYCAGAEVQLEVITLWVGFIILAILLSDWVCPHGVALGWSCVLDDSGLLQLTVHGKLVIHG